MAARIAVPLAGGGQAQPAPRLTDAAHSGWGCVRDGVEPMLAWEGAGPLSSMLPVETSPTVPAVLSCALSPSS